MEKLPLMHSWADRKIEKSEKSGMQLNCMQLNCAKKYSLAHTINK